LARITGLIDEYNLDQRKIPASRTRDPGASISGSWEIASTLRDAAGNVTGGVYMDKSGNTKTVRF
jgi:hypothetical protein